MRGTARLGTLLACTALLWAGCAGPGPAPAGEATVAPGDTVHLLLVIDVAGGAADLALEVVEAQDLQVHLPASLHQQAPGGPAAGWVGFTVPAGAGPGTRNVVLGATDADGARQTVAFALHVAVPADPLRRGDWVLVDFTLRSVEGDLLATTGQDVDASPLARDADYQPPAEPGPQPLPVDHVEGLPPELLHGLEGAGIGHQRTIVLPAFFGPSHFEQSRPREETLERTLTVDRYAEMPREQAEQMGVLPPGAQEGDPLQTGGPIPYVVETLDDSILRIEVDLRVGDRITLHEAWTQATVVAEVGEEKVMFRTDPPGQAGEPFTWTPGWPDATTVVATNATSITLRHSPAVGTTWVPQGMEGLGREATVVEVTPDTIVVREPNHHPLGGADVLLEVHLLERTAPPDG